MVSVYGGIEVHVEAFVSRMTERMEHSSNSSGGTGFANLGDVVSCSLRAADLMINRLISSSRNLERG